MKTTRSFIYIFFNLCIFFKTCTILFILTLNWRLFLWILIFLFLINHWNTFLIRLISFFLLKWLHWLALSNTFFFKIHRVFNFVRFLIRISLLVVTLFITHLTLRLKIFWIFAWALIFIKVFFNWLFYYLVAWILLLRRVTLIWIRVFYFYTFTNAFIIFINTWLLSAISHIRLAWLNMWSKSLWTCKVHLLFPLLLFLNWFTAFKKLRLLITFFYHFTCSSNSPIYFCMNI